MFAGFGLKATSAVVHFCPGCIFMTPAILSVIAFLALFAWRFVFAGLRRGPLAREIAAPQQHILEQDLNILDLVGVAIIPDNRPENGSNGANPIAPKNCAKTYLRRI